ncbi:MAG: hypothetical protein OJF55_001680 [Rhodanobacteraceae bacterium]|nr:MAG: hypothetical protein OJF55_001680 [Rhodanobacteraceae bacterium]
MVRGTARAWRVVAGNRLHDPRRMNRERAGKRRFAVTAV